jgi:hypothetical protein
MKGYFFWQKGQEGEKSFGLLAGNIFQDGPRG